MIDPKQIVEMVAHAKCDLATNFKTLDLLEGNLEPYVMASLKAQLSDRVFQYAKQRLVPINVFPRYIEKLTNIYQTGVTRSVENGDQSDIDLAGWYEKELHMNQRMHVANKMYNACKATLIHPYITEDGPELRIIQNDRFIVCSNDPIDPCKPTMVILIAGKDDKHRETYWVYTEYEFMVVKSDDTIDYEAMAAMGIPDGINPYGVLPFVYINSSPLRLRPIPDMDSIRITELVPTMLTDLNLAAMFAAFSINYITNGQVENLTYAPNALWFLKSDDPEKDVQIGSLKPEVDYQDVLNLIQSELSLWLGTKGIKSGAVAQLTQENYTSGIAKIIDEADTYDVRQQQTVFFQEGEHELWELILRDMHPVWVAQGLVENRTLFSPKATVQTKFSIMPVGTQRTQIINDQIAEYGAGFTTRERAVSALNPQMSMQEIEQLLAVIDSERSVPDAKNLLNGAQVSSSVDILTAAAIGTIPRDSAKALLMNAFAMDDAMADEMLGSIGKGFTPTTIEGNVSRLGGNNGNQVATGSSKFAGTTNA